MSEAILIVIFILALAILAKVGGLEPILQCFIAIISFIFSLLITVIVIACLCVFGLICIPLALLLLIGYLIMLLFEKVKK